MTYRAGDPDFEERRRKFYGMVGRHLSRPVNTAQPAKAAKKADKKAKPAKVETVIDGRPVEIEKYGSPGIASYRNNAADSMHWLINAGHLNSRIVGPRTDRAIELAWAEGRTRVNTATRLAELFENAELTPIRSPDYESVPGGSSGSRYVGNTKLACMKIVQDLRRDIPPACMQRLETVIKENAAPWHGLKKKTQQSIYDEIRMALDFAAFALDQHHSKAEVTEEILVQRWPAAQDWFTARRLRERAVSFKRDRKPR